MNVATKMESADEWLEQIKLQPENVAALLAYETRARNLVVDGSTGYVWNGGIGAGYGTSFKLVTAPTPRASEEYVEDEG